MIFSVEAGQMCSSRLKNIGRRTRWECCSYGCGSSSGNGVARQHSTLVTVMQPPSSMSLSSPTLVPGTPVPQGSQHQVHCTIAGVRPQPQVSWQCPPSSPCATAPPLVTPGPQGTVTLTSTANITMASGQGTFTLECWAGARRQVAGQWIGKIHHSSSRNPYSNCLLYLNNPT